MTDRFTAWMEQTAARDFSAGNLALLAVTAVIILASMSLWPTSVARWGRRVYVLCGIIIYASLFAFALAKLLDLAS